VTSGALKKVNDAQVLLKQREALGDILNQLHAAVKVLKVKAESGISDSDLSPLQRAISNAKKVRDISQLLALSM
jgi:hypothetical protein